MNHRLLLMWVILVCGDVTAKIIILDPGHGGIYGGARGVRGKLLEKNVALDVAQLLATLLRKQGHTVILTRETDKEFDKHDLIKDLAHRAEMTKTHNADIFVSIHFNSTTSHARRGYEIYVPYAKKYPAGSYQLASAVHYEIESAYSTYLRWGIAGESQCK